MFIISEEILHVLLLSEVDDDSLLVRVSSSLVDGDDDKYISCLVESYLFTLVVTNVTLWLSDVSV